MVRKAVLMEGGHNTSLILGYVGASRDFYQHGNLREIPWFDVVRRGKGGKQLRNEFYGVQTQKMLLPKI